MNFFFLTHIVLLFLSFDGVDDPTGCIHLGWTKYHAAGGLDAKSMTRHSDPEILKAGRLSNLAAWRECLHVLPIVPISLNDWRSQMVKSAFPAFTVLGEFVFFSTTTGRKSFNFLCPFICTTALLVAGCCIYGIGTLSLRSACF